MFIYLLDIHFIILEADSLKNKRKVVKSILDYARNVLKISSAEIAYQDIMNQAQLAFVTISNQKNIARNILENLLAYIESHYSISVLEYSIEEI